MAYSNPSFVNGQQPPLSAQNMNALADAVELLSVENGGTGNDNINIGAIMVGNATAPVSELHGTGALYAQTDYQPTFGTLPVNCGGTGVNTLDALKSAMGLSNAGFIVSATAPTDTTKLWINTTNKTLNYYSNGVWESIRGVFGS